MAQPQLLEKDKAYMVFVEKIDIKEKRPSFVDGAGVTKYNFLINIKTKDEQKYTVEYASPNKLPDEIVHGKWQWMRCIKPSAYGCEIVPCDPPGEDAPRGVSLPVVATDVVRPEERMNAPAAQAGFAPNRSSQEKALSVAISYAKDLKVAEIGKRKAGAAVTEEDIADVIAWGIKILHGMEGHLNF